VSASGRTPTVVGAGAVGLVVGARLARAGERVLFVTRRAEAAERLDAGGVRFEDPATGEGFRARVEAVAGAAAARDRIGRGPVLFCTRTAQLDDAARDVAGVAPDAVVASLLNGVESEAELARRFPAVLGVVVRQTCTRRADDAAAAILPGRLVVGTHPRGACAAARDLAERLRSAGYDVGLSDHIAEDKWLKLCINLMSAPNALVRREDHTGRAFVEIKARLLEEARAALAAAGITARSCDGRDRSLDEEIDHQRESLARGTSARPLPLYNQVWAALRGGGPVEADGYHRRILALASAHAIPAPQNERVLAALEIAAAEGRGPESVAAEELLAG